MVFGLFRSKRRTYVASGVYNMGGDLEDRPNLIRTTVASAVITGGPKTSVANRLVESNLQGHSFDQARWYRWAQTHYLEGQVSAGFSNRPAIDKQKYDQIQAAIPGVVSVPSDHAVKVQDAFVDYPSIDYWAERYILEHRPEDIETDWETDYDSSTGMLRIIFNDGSGGYSSPDEVVSVPDFDPEVPEYAYVHYYTKKPDFDFEWDIAVQEKEYAHDPGLSTTDGAWTLISDTPTTETVTKTNTVRVIISNAGVTLSDETTVTEEEEEFSGQETVHKRVVDLGADITAKRFVVERQRQTKTKSYILQTYENSTNSVDPDTGNSVSIITTSQVLRPRWFVTRDVQFGYVDDYSGPTRLMIYPLGSGNVVLDSLQTSGNGMSGFYPILPIRIRKSFVQNESVTKSYKKAHGTKVEDLREAIEDNDDLNDINHIFMVFGVEAKEPSRASKQYCYEFLKMLRSEQASNSADFQDYLQKRNAQEQLIKEQEIWEKGQLDVRNPLFKTPEPMAEVENMIASPVPSNTRIRIRTINRDVVNSPYDVRIEWAHIGETYRTGLGKRDAKPGDMWWDVRPNFVAGARYVPGLSFVGSIRGRGPVSHIRLYWQYEKDKYKFLDVMGMVHRNVVHSGKAEVTGLRDAIRAEEKGNRDEEEGFFFPLHDGTMKKLPLHIRNQLTVSNRLLVMNAFKVQKIRWYQRGIFRVLFFIGVILISAFFFPGAAGILGTNLAVGTSLGFVGISALIMGAVANSLAGILVMQIVQMGAGALLGDELGALLGQLIGVIAFQFMGGFGEGAVLNFASFMDPANLLRMTNAILSGITSWAGVRAGEINQKLEAGFEDYTDQSAHIQKKIMEIFGDGSVMLDPLLLMEEMGATTPAAESPSAFIYRTLSLGGSGLIEAQSEMITDFADLSLMLEGPETLFVD